MSSWPRITSFAVAPFTAAAGTGEFYQDPEESRREEDHRPGAVRLSRRSGRIRKRIALALKGEEGLADTPLKFTVTYDAAKDEGVDPFPAARPAARRSTIVTLDLDARRVKSSRGAYGTRRGSPWRSAYRGSTA